MAARIPIGCWKGCDAESDSEIFAEHFCVFKCCLSAMNLQTDKREAVRTHGCPIISFEQADAGCHNNSPKTCYACASGGSGGGSGSTSIFRQIHSYCCIKKLYCFGSGGPQDQTGQLCCGAFLNRLVLPIVRLFVNRLLAMTDASTWIENRRTHRYRSEGRKGCSFDSGNVQGSPIRMYMYTALRLAGVLLPEETFCGMDLCSFDGQLAGATGVPHASQLRGVLANPAAITNGLGVAGLVKALGPLWELLLEQDVCSLQLLCRNLVCPINARMFFLEWLQRNDIVVCYQLSTSVLHEVCRASIIQRYFLHRASALEGGSAIAGGFPAACFSQRSFRNGWQPGDIDVFVSSEDAYLGVERLFADTLGSAFDAETSLHEFAWYHGEDDGKSASLSLPHSIGRWVSGYAEFLCDRRFPTEVEIGWVRELAQTAAHLPMHVGRQEYKVVKTSRLKLRCAISTRAVPAPVRDINVIWVKVPPGLLQRRPLASIICESFDMIQCMVSLAVQPDLSFVFTEHCGAFSAIRERRLILNQAAFGSSVCVQMKRILKYVQRGFAWPNDGGSGDVAQWAYSSQGLRRMEMLAALAARPAVQAPNLVHDSSDTGSADARDQVMMASGRAEAAMDRHYQSYDYRIACEAAEPGSVDPVRLHFRRRRHDRIMRASRRSKSLP